MKTHERGFTLIEILVVITIIATLAGLVVVIVPSALERMARSQCLNNIRNITALLESAESRRLPDHSGPNLILYLVEKGQIAGEDHLEVLFCRGDLEESLRDAGGEAAYADLDLGREREYGHLTSYAGRDQGRPETRARPAAVPALVLVADDSEDHHNGKGICVGLTGGMAKWRDKVDDYKLDRDAPLVVGEESAVEELRCLKAD